MNTNPKHMPTPYNPGPVTTIERLALFVTPGKITPGWAELDSTGAPPKAIDGTWELCSLDDAPLAIFRDGNADFQRRDYDVLHELVKIANGEPLIADEAEKRLRALRAEYAAEQANTAEWRALHEEDARRTEKIIEEARRWKERALAAEGSVDRLTDLAQRAEREVDRARDRSTEREAQASRAVERAMSRAEQAHELYERESAERTRLREQVAGLEARLASARQQQREAEEANASRIAAVQANALNVITRVVEYLPGPVVDAEIVEPDFEISTWFADDNTPVVQIDTQRIEGRLRINLNDAPIFDGDPETEEPPGGYIDEFSEAGRRAADGATISRGLDAIRDLEERLGVAMRERDDALAEARAAVTAQEKIAERYTNADAWAREQETAAQHLRSQRDEARESARVAQDLVDAIASELTPGRRDVCLPLAAKQLRERFEAGSTVSKQAAESFDKARAEQLDEIRTLRIERDNARADAKKLREINELQRRGIDESERSRRDALQQRDDLDRKLTEAETMRKRLDERLASERHTYKVASSALRSMLRERDHVIALAAAEIEREGLTATAFERARQALPALEAEQDAREGGLVDVIRQYDGLAQIGANLARGARALGGPFPREDERELQKLGALYEQEHEKLKR